MVSTCVTATTTAQTCADLKDRFTGRVMCLPREGTVATGRLFRKRTLAQALVLVGVLVLAGMLVAGCGSAITPQAGADGTSGSLVNVIVVSGTGWATSLPDKTTIQVSVENDGATSAAALDANIAAGLLSCVTGELSALIGRPTTPLKEGLKAALSG